MAKKRPKQSETAKNGSFLPISQNIANRNQSNYWRPKVF